MPPPAPSVREARRELEVGLAWRVMWRAVVVVWCLEAAWVVPAFWGDAFGPFAAVMVMSLVLALLFVPVLLVGGAATVVVERVLRGAPFPVLLVGYAVAGALVGTVAVAVVGFDSLLRDVAGSGVVVGGGALAAVVARWWVRDADARAARRGTGPRGGEGDDAQRAGSERADPDSDEAAEDAIDDATRGPVSR